MTYMYYGAVGTSVTIIVAIVVSYFTASDADAFDEKLLHPMVIALTHWWRGTSPANCTPNANINQGFECNEEMTNAKATNGEWQGTNESHAKHGTDTKRTLSDSDYPHSKTMPAEKFTFINVS